MKILSPEIQEYLERHTSPLPPYLAELERETHLKEVNPGMLSGPYLGQTLVFLSKMIRPKRILEIGTFTGYSALCLAQGLEKGGKLITIEVDPEREKLIREYIKKSGKEDMIELIIGDGLEIFPSLNGQFDVIFLDADKQKVMKLIKLAVGKLTKEGFIIIDNALWYGQVTEFHKRSHAEAMHQMNTYIANEPGLENLILPVRDGLMIVRKSS